MLRTSIRFSVATSFIMFFISSVFAKADAEFPHRKLYPAVPYIELADFYKKHKTVIIVDVRSAYEYQTLRIKGAINIPLSSAEFISDMKQLRSSNPDTMIVVYCNGKTCKKSYKAVQKCRNHKIKNVVAYDAGIMDWGKAYPSESVLLGESPINPKDLISKATFKKRLVEPKAFEAMMNNKNVIVVDVRDRFQREGISLFPGIDRRASLDDQASLDQHINQAKKENKVLLIYDASGKQVRWLMYYLQRKNVKNYHFMKGGANAYYKMIRKEYTQ